MMMMMMMMMAMKAMLLDGDIVDGINGSLRKEMTLQCHSWFLHEMTSKNERRNSILMTCHYPHLGSASDWSCHHASGFQVTGIIKGFLWV